MKKKKKSQVTFSGLGSVGPVFIICFHLLPTDRQLPITAKEPLCLPGQGGEIYPAHSTWEGTWVWLESKGTWRAFLFHLLSHQSRLQRKVNPANRNLVFSNCPRSFPWTSFLLLIQTILRVWIWRKIASVSPNYKEKGKERLEGKKNVFSHCGAWFKDQEYPRSASTQ